MALAQCQGCPQKSRSLKPAFLWAQTSPIPIPNHRKRLRRRPCAAQINRAPAQARPHGSRLQTAPLGFAHSHTPLAALTPPPPASSTGLVTVSAGTLELRHEKALGDGGTSATSIALSMAAMNLLYALVVAAALTMFLWRS